MASGDTRVQDVLDALAEQAETVDGINAAYGSDVKTIQKLPCVIFSWFSDIDTAIRTESTQVWTIAAKGSLYTASIRGNELRPNLSDTNNLIHDLVDLINRHPYNYPHGSKMSLLRGVDRISVVRVRPAEFGLQYAGHSYFGAELFLDIKMHRRIER